MIIIIKLIIKVAKTYLRERMGCLSGVKVILDRLMLCFLFILFKGPISSFLMTILGIFSSFQRNNLALVVTQAKMSPIGEMVSLCGGDGKDTGGSTLEPVLASRWRVASRQLSRR